MSRSCSCADVVRLGFVFTGLAALVAGCVTVKPSERQHLAKPEMAPATDLEEDRWHAHIDQARHGAMGGNGAAGNSAAGDGEDNSYMSGLSTDLNFAGHGGGGAGRIRINVVGDDVMTTGIVSPNPTTGALGVR